MEKLDKPCIGLLNLVPGDVIELITEPDAQPSSLDSVRQLANRLQAKPERYIVDRVAKSLHIVDCYLLEMQFVSLNDKDEVECEPIYFWCGNFGKSNNQDIQFVLIGKMKKVWVWKSESEGSRP